MEILQMPTPAGSNGILRVEAKVRHLTVYLLKQSVRKFEDALDKEVEVEPIPLKKGFPFKGIIYREQTKPNPTGWKEFLSEGTDDPLAGLQNQHQSVVLFIQPKGSSRIFAFLFGHARFLLDQSLFVTDFGLKVVMNVVDPDKLRSLDAATLEETPVQTRKQVSRVSALELFDMNRDADMLRALTGFPKEVLDDGTVPRIGKQISGSASLVIRPAIHFYELGDLAKELLGFYERNDYQKHGFDWVDHLRPVKDRTVIDQLDTLLLDAIHNQETDLLSLTPPETVDWQEIESVRFGSSKKKTYPHFLIEELYDYKPDPTVWSIETLKSCNVSLLGATSGEPRYKFPLYRCLSFGCPHEKKQYVLTSGAWFNIDVDFAQRITDYIDGIPESTITLRPFAKIPDKDEGTYTDRICKGTPEFALMDKKLVRPTNARSSIEVCDIFTSSKQFVHIKPYKGSSNLSHLFAQGQVSADLYQGDPGFRTQAKRKVATTRRGIAKLIQTGAGMVQVSEYEVVFAIIKKKPKPGLKWQHSLPFFAQLHLMQTATALRSKTFQVGIKLIELA